MNRRGIHGADGQGVVGFICVKAVINKTKHWAKIQTNGVIAIIGRPSVENSLQSISTQLWRVPRKFLYAKNETRKKRGQEFVTRR